MVKQPQLLVRPALSELPVMTLVFPQSHLKSQVAPLLCPDSPTLFIAVSLLNFLLVKLQDAQALFEYLIREKVITRNRSNVPLCEDTIRITIGLATENTILLEKIKSFYL